MTNRERGDLPGSRIAYWTLFQEKIGADGRSIGVTAPDGKFYRFERGERLAFLQFSELPGERVAVITESGGTKRLFESWVLNHKGSHS